MEISQKYRHELSVYLPMSFVGGFLEIYTYINMSGLFANAQTSNLVMLFNGLWSKNWSSALYCIVPIILYIAGISVTETIPEKLNDSTIRWPKLCVLIEIICMSAVAFSPASLPGKVAALPVFFLTAMQYNTFRSMQGQGVSTVFCTNNLRQAVIHYWHYKKSIDKNQIVYMSVYIFVIAVFALGVTAGFFLSHHLGVKAILVCDIVMLYVFLKLHFHGHKFM